MRFLASIFMLLTVCLAVFTPYFIGHGIVSEEAWPWIVAAVLPVLAAVCGFVYMKLADRAGEPAGH